MSVNRFCLMVPLEAKRVNLLLLSISRSGVKWITVTLFLHPVHFGYPSSYILKF
jgi:hypothetical protein